MFLAQNFSLCLEVSFKKERLNAAVGEFLDYLN